MRDVLKDKSYRFALRIVQLFNHVDYKAINPVISRQVLKSGTSIGANISEANYGQSKADFIHKLSIAQKECSETIYWLNLIKDSELLEIEEAESLIEECTEIMKILVSSIKTSKQSLRKL